MSHPLGMTTGRMLGAAALSAPFFGVFFTGGLVITSTIASIVSPTVGGFSIPRFEIVSWLLFGFVYVTGFGAIAALVIGFPLSLVARRLIRRVRRPRSVVLAAFLVAAVAAGITVFPLRPLLFPNIDGLAEDPWSAIAYVALIELSAGLSAALAWVMLRSTSRSEPQLAGTEG